MAFISNILNMLFGRFFDFGLSIEYIESKEESEEVEESEEYRRVHMQTIRELLNNLDLCYQRLSNKNFSEYTPKSTIKFLNTVGPTVLPDWTVNAGVLPIPIKKRPAIIYLSNYLPTRYAKNDDEIIPPFAFFAVKTDKPYFVMTNTDDADFYEIGCGYIFDAKETVWGSGYIKVTKDGEIIFPKVLMYNHHKNYTQKTIETQPIIKNSIKNKKLSQKDAEKNLAEIIKSSFFTWSQRQDYWKVSTKKNKQRVTFLIDKKKTKYFFKDREIEAYTPTGQKKKIIHFVKEHIRQTTTKEIAIKAHLRGLREFVWLNYYCAVTAPKMHKFNIDDFELSAVTEKQSKGKNKTISGKATMKLLSKIEDQQKFR